MANLIPEEKISEIINAADIVAVISEAVPLKKAGKDLVGLCPFHSEKTPSFSVSPDRQLYYCFGCGRGGNVITFVMEHGGLSFPEAAKSLGAKYGVEIPEGDLSPDEIRRMEERERLYGINRKALDFFHETLKDSPHCEGARRYLKERGFSGGTIEKFGLGFAPNAWGSMEVLFKNYPLALVEKAGLIIPRSRGRGYYDRFRNRIIFPILDLRKRVLGFGGRVMDDSKPKYLNSPETPVFNKSNTLYGLGSAMRKIRETGAVYIGEGYFDFLALYQHGFENSVATLGTSLTAEHVRLLKRGAEKAILVYDSDEAGVKAAQRSIGIFRKEGVSVNILVLPRGDDPDSFLFKNGASAFEKAAKSASPAISFLTEVSVKKHGLTVEGKMGVIADMAGPISSVQDKLERSLYINELSGILNVEEGLIKERIGQRGEPATDVLPFEDSPEPPDLFPPDDFLPEPEGFFPSEPDDLFFRAPDHAPGPSRGGSCPEGPGGRMERRIICMMLQFPEIISEVSGRGVISLFDHSGLQSIGKTLVLEGAMDEVTAQDVISLFEGRREKELALELFKLDEDVWSREGCLKLLSQFEKSKEHARKSVLNRIKAAEEANNHELVMELLEKLDKPVSEDGLNNLESAGGKSI